MKKSNSYKLIFGALGIFLMFIGVTCMLPLVLLFFYPEESQYWMNFFIPGIASIVVGSALTFLLKSCKNTRLGKHQDSILLVLIWLLAVNICAIPFLLRSDMNFSQSVFETTSGFSTIGLTVYQDFDCHLYVFYRSILTLVGGVGLVLVITSAFSDRYHLNLYVAEGHSDKPLPNLRKSAIVILGIYLGIIVVGVIAYVLAGMSWFDAIVHSISAVATGGFSSKSGGLIEVPCNNFLAVEIISIVLMILGATNFLTHFLILTGKGKKALKDCELRFFLAAVVIFVPLFFVATLVDSTITGYSAFKYSAFTFLSAITTTGFSNIANIRDLGEATMFLIIFINVIGGGAGSTAGGVKQYRVAVAAKSFYWGTRARLGNPRMVYPRFIYRCGEEIEIGPNESIEAFGYIILYLLLMFFGSFLVTVFSKMPFSDCLFEFSNAISSTGLSNGLTAACRNNPGVLWTMTAAMFAGRLEILAIYFALYRIIRDILGKDTL
ncbi:MAG: TrkH family potassium uptake protein [Bacilli bacterium]|nr:TrkH family potassium uptake protein [Bacilli bacterium]